MTYAEFINKLNGGARWDVGVSINRSNALPLDANSVFFSLEDAQSYVAGTLEGRLANAYPGQLLAVVTETATTIHYIDINAEGVMSLKEVGAKVEAANASIEIVDGKITIAGFEAADALTLPQKQADGTIAWVPISAIVEGDGNTVTEVKAVDKTIDVQSTQTSDDSGKVTSIKYDIKVNVSAEEGNAVEVKEDGIFVAVPEAYDDTQVKADIKAVSDLVGTTSVDSQIDAKIEELDLGNTYAEKEHTHEIEDVNGLQDALDGKQVAGDYATKTEAQGYADAKDEAIAAAKKAGDDAQAYAEEVESRVTDVEGRVTDVEDAIEVLNGDATTEGSVAKTVKDAINTFATEITENNTIDTFKELVDYVGEHGGEAAEMASAITSLEEKVGEKSVKVQIEEAIAAENLDQYATDEEVGALEDRVAAVEGKVDVDKVSVAIAAALEEAKEYADNGDADTIYNDSELRERIEALEEVDHEHENKDVIDGITAQNIVDWNDAVAKEHEHENKDVLDGITSAKVEAWDKAQENAEATASAALEAAREEITAEIDADVKVVNDALQAYVESNNAEVAKKANQADLDTTNAKVDALAGIKSVNTDEFNIDNNGQLAISAVAQNKVTGLVDALKGKVDTISTEYKGEQVAWTLLSPENQAKLAALVIGDNGVEISGKVNADNVEELNTWITKNRDSIGGLISVAKEAKLDGIEEGAQVNKLESVSINGTVLEISNKGVNIPLATADIAGLVVSSDAVNGVAVATDGKMTVNNISTDKLVQGDSTFILDGGDAQA